MARLSRNFSACRLTFVASLGLAFGASVSGQVEGLQSAIKSIYKENSEAVVRVIVATQKENETESDEPFQHVFSGFFISKDGKAITSSMPPKEKSRVWIEKNGISYLAEIIGSDTRANISLLQVINLPKNLSYIELEATEIEDLVGSFAVAITSPLIFDPSPSFGIVTGFESSFAKDVFPFTFIRVGLPIGPAEVGSPIFDISGNLLGISMASIPEIASSYIIPVKAIKRIVDDFLDRGSVRYGVLPIGFEERADRYNIERGIYVNKVVPGSPAARAGVQIGDTLATIDDQKVGSLNQARDLIFFKLPGEFIHFKVLRDDKELEFAILLEPQEDHLPIEAVSEPEKEDLEK